MKLSENFDSEELACKCCGACHLDQNLIDGLQKLRDKIGKPIYVLSGYRCFKHNDEIGGAPTSQHMYGRAADIQCNEIPPKQLMDIAKTIEEFRGFGGYDKFIHVDVRDNFAFWERWVK